MYECSLWIDGNLKVQEGALNIFEKAPLQSLILLEHYSRNCIFEEARVCIEEHLDNPQLIQDTIEGYNLAGIQSPTGLYYGNFIGRWNRESVKRFNQLWWHLITCGTSRDQIHLPVAATMTSISPRVLKKENRGNLFLPSDHKKGRTKND